jgi:hypothetical protein
MMLPLSPLLRMTFHSKLESVCSWDSVVKNKWTCRLIINMKCLFKGGVIVDLFIYSENFFFFFLYPFCLLERWGVSHYILESLYTPGRWLALRWRPVTWGNWTHNIYIPSGARLAQLYPQALGADFSRLYDTHELRWGYSLLPAITRGFGKLSENEYLHAHWRWASLHGSSWNVNKISPCGGSA